MSATPAKKSGKTAGGASWSKVSSPTRSTSTRPAAKPSRSTSIARRGKPAAKAPAAKRQAAPSAPAFTMPAHVQREIVGLVLLVIAILAMLGLLTWSRGGQGIVGL